MMYSYGPPHMAKQKQDDQLEHTYSSYVRRWMIGRSGKRGSGISVLAARHDDDDDDYLTNNWGYNGVHTFPKDISLRVDAIVWLKYELANYGITIQHANGYEIMKIKQWY